MNNVESVFIRRILESVERRDFEVHTVSLDDTRFAVFVLPLNEAEVSDDEPGFDKPWKPLFLDWLRKGLTIDQAAELAGVTRRHAYRCKKTDASFRREWEAARKKRRSEGGDGG